MVRTMQDLSNQELLDLARLFTTQPAIQPGLILELASELRRRNLLATEEAMLRLAAAYVVRT